MPWKNDPEKRRQDARNYGPEYKRHRAVAWRRAGGRCELLENGRPCRSRDRCQVDHKIPVSQGGTHSLDNLRVLCAFHHQAKTAQEGKGYRAGRKPKAEPALITRTVWLDQCPEMSEAAPKIAG
jgi:5-methylcytosine-specific restriction endonuclease McrA